ncbi:ABC transporter substrate-binding protein [Anopheles sinensis]|uniref:ABC transporter substrate-binding protein n=1 Tax=Anopheles sinensis TaxID=74873 RepID=A0A084VVC4_ANOSI|nr:ABC transporter substrate-binding protein [Anopheles sinensis]
MPNRFSFRQTISEQSNAVDVERRVSCCPGIVSHRYAICGQKQSPARSLQVGEVLAFPSVSQPLSGPGSCPGKAEGNEQKKCRKEKPSKEMKLNCTYGFDIKTYLATVSVLANPGSEPDGREVDGEERPHHGHFRCGHCCSVQFSSAVESLCNRFSATGSVSKW